MRRAALVVAALALGCVRGGTTSPAPTPDGTPPAPAAGGAPIAGGVTPSPNAGVAFAWSAAVERYVLLTETTVDPESTTTPLPAGAMAPETFSRAAYVSFRHDAVATPIRVTGTVDSFTIAGGGRIAGTATTQLTNVPFESTLAGVRVLSFGSPMADAPCALPVGALLDAARDLVIALPARLAPGAEWSDTVATVGCRGELSITTTSRRRWVVEQVDSAGGAPTAHVVRRSETTIAGSGTQRGSAVSLSGEGTGELRYLVDVLAGRVERAEGTSSTRLAFEAEGQRRGFVQRVRQELRHLAPAP